ncbi:MAG: nucleotidyl transferase AbiEii/AbiGii toxin family protein [bacterium]
MSVNREIIRDIAIELAIDPSFIEKDLYVIEILDALSRFNHENIQLIFSGGTCLSKGYGLIKRFSEDIDFRISTSALIGRSQRKEIRQAIINAIKENQNIKVLENTLESRNGSKFFSFYIEYPQNFELSTSLRPHLKVEFTFEEVILPTTQRNITYIIGDYIQDCPTVSANCISPVEIGANKFSALMWRLDVNDKVKDPNIMRHLHDLSALESHIKDNDFINTVKNSFELDKGRCGSNKELSLIDFAALTLQKLKENSAYAREYTRFVDAMSYATDDEVIKFSDALMSFEKLVKFVRSELD